VATIAIKDATGATVTAALVPATGGAVADADKLPVIGPLTNAQLRASALDVNVVSGGGGGGGSGLTDSQLRAAPVPVTAAALPLPTGAATAAAQTTGNTSLGSIDGKLPALSGGRIPVVLPAGGSGLTDAELRATPVPVSGTVSTGGLTDTQLRATAVPVSAAALPLPTGAATAAAQTSGNASLSSMDGKLPALSGGRIPVVLPAGGGGLTDAELRAAPVPVEAIGELIEAIEAQRMALQALVRTIGQSMPDTAGRLRVLVDSISASLTLATITTVGTVTTVSTLTNQTQIGGLAATEQIPSLMRLGADSARRNINVT
jgi:hypothetical protein